MRFTMLTTLFCLATLTQALAIPKRSITDAPVASNSTSVGNSTNPAIAKGTKEDFGIASGVTGAVGLGLGGFLTPAGAITETVAGGLFAGGLKKKDGEIAVPAANTPSAPAIPVVDAKNGTGNANSTSAAKLKATKEDFGIASGVTGAVGLGLGGFLTPAGAITETVAGGLFAGGLKEKK